MTNSKRPLVGVLMGSDSDWDTMKLAVDACAEFGVATETHVMSAHHVPDDVAKYTRTAHTRGLRVIIAGAGGAAHLAGAIAAHTPLPVIGVPVATVAVGAGRNAGLLAVQILATAHARLRAPYLAFKGRLAEESRAKNRRL